MNALLKFLLVSFASVPRLLLCQPKDSTSVLAPQSICCDNGYEGIYCNSQSSMHLKPSCNEVTLYVRDCVDATRDGRLCGGVGSHYCSEVDNNGSYPRYYAVWEPIEVSPASLTFTAQYGSSNPPSQGFLILNGVSDVRLLRT